jgi:hypothetical protein
MVEWLAPLLYIRKVSGTLSLYLFLPSSSTIDAQLHCLIKASRK